MLRRVVKRIFSKVGRGSGLKGLYEARRPLTPQQKRQLALQQRLRAGMACVDALLLEPIGLPSARTRRIDLTRRFARGMDGGRLFEKEWVERLEVGQGEGGSGESSGVSFSVSRRRPAPPTTSSQPGEPRWQQLSSS